MFLKLIVLLAYILKGLVPMVLLSERLACYVQYIKFRSGKTKDRTKLFWKMILQTFYTLDAFRWRWLLVVEVILTKNVLLPPKLAVKVMNQSHLSVLEQKNPKPVFYLQLLSSIPCTRPNRWKFLVRFFCMLLIWQRLSW